MVPPLLLAWCAGLFAGAAVGIDTDASFAELVLAEGSAPFELTGVPDPPPGLNSVCTAVAERWTADCGCDSDAAFAAACGWLTTAVTARVVVVALIDEATVLVTSLGATR